MKIYFSSRVLQPRQSGGIAAYFLGLLEAFATQRDQNDELHLGLTIHGEEFADAVAGRVQSHWIAGIGAAIQAENERTLIDQLKPDWVIYFVADPLNYYGEGQFKVACCIADLQHLHLPAFFPSGDRLARDQAFSSAVGHSDLIFTLSAFCQRDLISTFGLTEAQVRVVYPAARGLFVGGPAGSEDVARAHRKFRLPRHFAIFPGNFWKHKNHVRLLSAFARWRQTWKSPPAAAVGPVPHLVLVGSATGRDPTLVRLLSEGARAGWLSTLGYVSESELHALLSGARCLVFPSLFEGFGIPVAEAFGLGRPVACSDCCSLPEVGGELAHYFDPRDEDSMIAAMDAAWTLDADDAFVARARAHAKRFQYRLSGAVLRDALDDASSPAPRRSPAEFCVVDEPPTVSIVTPSYQHAAYLLQCIESVLTQDYPHIEYQVFDGGSTDGTVEILRGFGTKFHWESGPDGGQTNAINKGLRRARGQILAYLNSDDFLLPGAVSRVVKAWRLKPSVDVFYGKAHWTDESGNETGPYATRPFDSESFLGDCFICQPAAFWRRRVQERFGPFDERYQFAMDYEYWQRILAGGGLISFLDEFLACSRVHPSTKSQAQRGRVFQDIFKSQWHHWGYVHRDWWLGLFHHLTEERKGVWPRVIPRRSKSRGFLARQLSLWVRKPVTRDGHSRRQARFGGIYPDGWMAAKSWIDVSLQKATELHFSGVSPITNEVRVIVEGRQLCHAKLTAGKPFRLAWNLGDGYHRIEIRSRATRPPGDDARAPALLLHATNLFLH